MHASSSTELLPKSQDALSLKDKCYWTKSMFVLHKAVYVDETIMPWFLTNMVRARDRGHPMPMCRKGKQKGWQSILFELAYNQSPSAYLFTQLFVYWRRRDSFIHLLKWNKKSSIPWQEQREVCHKMEALEIEGDKHNVVYIAEARFCGRVVAPVHKARHTWLKMEQVLCGSDFRWRDWEMWGRGQH